MPNPPITITFSNTIVPILTTLLTLFGTKIISYKFKKQDNEHIEGLKKQAIILKLNYEREVKTLEIVWCIICRIENQCGNYDESIPLMKKLHTTNNELYEFIIENEPFIDEEIYNNLSQFAELTGPEIYKPSSYNEVIKIKNRIGCKYRERLSLNIL